MLNIRIRRLGTKDENVIVEPSCSVSGLKEAVCELTGVATQKQRLIFRGKALSVSIFVRIVLYYILTFCEL